MSLNIKNAETEALARELTRVTGENMTQAISVALRERLARLESTDAAAVVVRTARIRAVAADAASRWVIPYTSVTMGDLLYDDMGLPA